MTIQNRTKKRLRSKEVVVGCFLRYPVGTLAELVALGGWDFVVLDAEHGSLQPADIEDLARACELHGVTPLVRVATNEPSTILRFLDAGAHGVLVPSVESRAQAESVVQAVKYQPIGMRGLAATRSARFGVPESIGDYTRRANDETLVGIQVETAEGSEQVSDLAAVEEVDVVFIGPTDLAHSLGHVGNPDHPEVGAAMNRIATAVLEAGKALGIYVADPGEAARWIDLGATFIATGVEPLLRSSMHDYLASVRET